MPSHISTPTAQQLAANIKNADGTTPIYAAGAWDFKNASGTSVFTISSAGVVTLPTNDKTHILSTTAAANFYTAFTLGTADSSDYGRLLLSSGGAFSTTRGAYIALVGNENTVYGANTGGTLKCFIGEGSSATFEVGNSSGQILSGTAAGAWKLGNGKYNTQSHGISGTLSTSDTGTSDYDRSLLIGANYSASGFQNPLVARSTSLTGGTFQIQCRTTDSTTDIFRFTSNVKAGTEETVASCTQAGTWTWGAAASGQFVIQGAAAAGAQLKVDNKNAVSTTANGVDVYFSGDSDCTGGYFYACRNSSSSVIGRIEAASNTTTTFTGSSDARLKMNPSEFSGLDKVLLMIPREFEWKSNPGKRDKGFFAQELFEIYPEAVSVGKDILTKNGELERPWGIDYGRLTPVLVKAIQEQQATIEALQARLTALEAK